MDRLLLNEMSRTFNSNSANEPPQINLNEDPTLKWRGLHNNQYASNKRRTRKSARIGEEDRGEEDSTLARPSGSLTPSDSEAKTLAMAPPTTIPSVESDRPAKATKSERVLRRTRTNSEAIEVAAKKANVVEKTNANGNSKQQQQASSSSKVNVVVISTKSNKDKEPKDNDDEELVVLPAKLHPDDDDDNRPAAEAEAGKAPSAGNNSSESKNDSNETTSSSNGGDSGSAVETRHSKRVTRRRPSTAAALTATLNKDEVTITLKRKSEEDPPSLSQEKRSTKPVDPVTEEEAKAEPTPSLSSSTSTTNEEKKPRLLMKIRTDNKSMSIVKPAEETENIIDQEWSTKPVDESPMDTTPPTAATEPKKRGRKPGSSLKNKFTEKVKILPKRTGIRGQLSPEATTSVQQLSQQRPSRRIKPTPKILENEELRHGFEVQNSSRVIGFADGDKYPFDSKKAGGSRPSGSKLSSTGHWVDGQQGGSTVEQLNVDNIYPTSLTKPCPEPEDFLNELKSSKNGNSSAQPTEEMEKLNKKQQKLKERHFQQLGLRKTSRSDTNSEPDEAMPNNGGFRAPATPNHPKTNGGRLQVRPRAAILPVLLSDELQVRRKVNTNSVVRHEKFLCLCTQMSEFYSHNKTAKSLYCSAVDQIRTERVGCCNDIGSNQLNLQRPSARVSFMVLCNSHKNRFHVHHCCPICGVFCTEGQFMLCPRNHLFHRECVLRTMLASERIRKQNGGAVKCPHCGVDVSEPEVDLYMECRNELTYYPNQEGFIKTARISLTNGVVAVPQRPITNGQLEFNIDNLIPESVQNIRDRYRQQRKGGAGGGGGVGGSSSSRGGASDIAFTSHEFYHAVNNDDIEKVAEIIASGFDVSSPFKEFHNGTCLHLIAHYGSLNMLYLILSRAASVDFINSQDKELRTAAMCAVAGQKHELLRLLIQCGADVTRKGPDGMTVLHLAAKVGNLAATEIILEHYRLKVTFQKFESFINAVDVGQWTALVWAAENGLSNIESYLMSLGASPNICDSENNSALHWAALSNNVETILPLLGSNCDFNLQNVNGDTALHIACRHGNAHMCLIFIAHGSDLQIKNLADETPLDCVPDRNGTCAKLLKYNLSLKAIGGAKSHRRVLSNDLSLGRESYPVKLITTEENPTLPNFKYVTTAIIMQNSIQIDRRISQMRICACPDNCTSDVCQCSEISSQNWYDANGRLSSEFNFDDPPMIFECNDVCGCHKLLCKNRVVQHGGKVAIQVENSAKKGKGWAAKSITEIPKGTFVAEYTGEILTNMEADHRVDDSYFFDLGGSEHCIDANFYGNVSRFFNHSCNPNVVPIRVYFDHQDLRFPKIAFFASENIQANQEITFDYGDKFWMVKHKYFTCQCGAPNCRYSAQTISQTVEEINQRSQPITIIT